MTLAAAFDPLAGRRVILIGGKGGVGKTTVSIAVALHLAASRDVILFTTDPASNLADIAGDELRTEALDAVALYRKFLDRNLESFLELGDRGTYLDKDELRRFFELSLPGVDELMAWMRIGALADENPDATIVVDTAPTGHTLRMLGSADHFRQFAEALDSMQAKHRGMVRQFTRRNVRDAMDAFVEQFEASAARTRALLTDPARTSFVAVTLSEPWVVEQTERLVREVRADGIEVPFTVLNRAIADPDCVRDRERAERDAEARARLAPIVDAARSCVPLDTAAAIAQWASCHPEPPKPPQDSLLKDSGSNRRRRTVEGPPNHVPQESSAGNPATPPHPPSAPFGSPGSLRAGSSPPLKSAGAKDARIQSSAVASSTTPAARAVQDDSARRITTARLTFLAGKGGVGKTTSAVSIALQLANRNSGKRYTVISVDPAHTLRDVFADQKPPSNLTVETIDTKEKWRRFRDSLGEEIERAIGAITPGGMTVAYDAEAMKKLIEIAPPGADELFAITRLADLIADESQEAIIVDTAPTGHFLRLIDLPRTAGEWVREFMRILLHYRELIPAGSLAEELIRASRALHALDEAMRSENTRVIVVTRPERIVIAESQRLIAAVEERGMKIGGVIANYMTPDNDCACDQSLRGFEQDALRQLGRKDVIEIARRDAPVTILAELAALVPLHNGSAVQRLRAAHRA
ncbi:MAG: arsenite/tail-anchored protein-transporting ATPase [Thermoanaerobaculia bacterium]|nr:arsenite/tail-anchored protein-transporting ATPase [Thermoanaerobaculia bacterium]